MVAYFKLFVNDKLVDDDDYDYYDSHGPLLSDYAKDLFDCVKKRILELIRVIRSEALEGLSSCEKDYVELILDEILGMGLVQVNVRIYTTINMPSVDLYFSTHRYCSDERLEIYYSIEDNMDYTEDSLIRLFVDRVLDYRINHLLKV